MPRPPLSRILEEARRAPTPEALARRLGIPESTARLYLAGLTGMGLAKRVPAPGTGACDCSSCPLRRLCRV